MRVFESFQALIAHHCKAHCSQAEYAAQIGVCRSSVSKFLNGGLVGPTNKTELTKWLLPLKGFYLIEEVARCVPKDFPMEAGTIIDFAGEKNRVYHPDWIKDEESWEISELAFTGLFGADFFRDRYFEKGGRLIAEHLRNKLIAIGKEGKIKANKGVSIQYSLEDLITVFSYLLNGVDPKDNTLESQCIEWAAGNVSSEGFHEIITKLIETHEFILNTLVKHPGEIPIACGLLARKIIK